MQNSEVALLLDAFAGKRTHDENANGCSYRRASGNWVCRMKCGLEAILADPIGIGQVARVVMADLWVTMP